MKEIIGAILDKEAIDIAAKKKMGGGFVIFLVWTILFFFFFWSLLRHDHRGLVFILFHKEHRIVLSGAGTL